MKRLPIRWARAASLDLIEIVEFIRRDRPEAARKLGRNLLLQASRLSRNPLRGKLVQELLDHNIQDYRQIVVSPYRLIHAIRSGYIDIVAVIDGRRDIESALLQRLLR